MFNCAEYTAIYPFVKFKKDEFRKDFVTLKV